MSLALLAPSAADPASATLGANVQTVASIFAILLAIGAVSTGVAKAVSGLRKFSRLLDGFLGDGTTKHPSVPDRLTGMEDRLTAVETAVSAAGQKIDSHVDTDAAAWKAEGEAWGHKLDGQVSDLDHRVSELEQKKGPGPVVASRT